MILPFPKPRKTKPKGCKRITIVMQPEGVDFIMGNIEPVNQSMRAYFYCMAARKKK